jgi:hypothetical protein
MKKILIRLVIGVLALLVLAVVGVTLFLGQAVKKGVEVVGPQLTKVEVRLDGVSLSLLSGRVALKGLFVGNPPGYKTESAIKLGSAVVAAKPSSFFADKLVVQTINIQAPEITFEGGLKENNLSKILENLDAAAGGSGQTAPQTGASSGASKKLQVDELIVAGGRVNVTVNALGDKTLNVALPDIHLSNLGTGPDGITVADISEKLLKAILEKATEAAGKAAADAAVTAGKDAANKAVDQATKSVTDLLKKKK